MKTFKEKLKHGNSLAVMRRELEDIVEEVDHVLIAVPVNNESKASLLRTKVMAITALMENERFFM